MHSITEHSRILCFLLVLFVCLCLGQCLAEATQAAAPATTAPSASGTEVKAGLTIEKRDLTAAADTFEIAPDAKIYAWVKVRDVAPDSKVTIAFKKGDKVAFSKEIAVPSIPYRIYAYKTFRKGDGGAWTIVVSGPDGKELGSTALKVTIKE
jgi:hypothetical protein